MAWFAIGGLYGAVAWLPLSADQRHTVGRALLSLVILSATVIGARVTSDGMRPGLVGSSSKTLSQLGASRAFTAC